jgi:hypothetical protein
MASSRSASEGTKSRLWRSADPAWMPRLLAIPNKQPGGPAIQEAHDGVVTMG